MTRVICKLISCIVLHFTHSDMLAVPRNSQLTWSWLSKKMSR